MLGGDLDIWSFAETSPGRIQWRIDFDQGFSRHNRKRHESLQDGLTRFISTVTNQDNTKPISDLCVTYDSKRLLRNFDGYGLQNHKYPEKPLIRLTKAKRKAYSGKDLFPILYQFGYIQKPKTEKKKWFSLSSSINKIRRVLKAENGILECTHKELAERIGRHINTTELCLKILQKHGEIGWKLVGNNKAGNKRRSIIYSTRKALISEQHKLSSKDKTLTPVVLNKKNNTHINSVLKEFEGKTIEIGLRDKFTFAATRELAYLARGNITPDEVYVFLKEHYDYSELQSYPEKEMQKNIVSALRVAYKFPLSMAKLTKWGLKGGLD